MMKRLLTTTMLASAVTVGGSVSALAVDFTLKADSKLQYRFWSDDQDNKGGANDSKIINESHVIIEAAETSDSGLTYGTYFRIEAETGNGGESNLKEDGHRLYVSGDFGKLVLGGANAGDTHFADVMVRNVNDEATTGKDLPGFNYFTDKAKEETISYHLPSFGGLAGAVSFGDAGDSSKADVREIGLTYTHDLGPAAFTLRYANASKSADGGSSAMIELPKGKTTDDAPEFGILKKDVKEVDGKNMVPNPAPTGKRTAQSYGFDITSGAFGFHVSANSNNVKAASGMDAHKVSNLGYAATYQATGNLKLFLGRASAKDKAVKLPYESGTTGNEVIGDAKSKIDVTSLGADYTIAPGLTTGFAYTTWDGENTRYMKGGGDFKALTKGIKTGPVKDRDTTSKQSGSYTVLYMKVSF